MPVETQAQPTTVPERPRRAPWKRALVYAGIVLGAAMVAVLIAIAIPYNRLAKKVDEQLAAGPFARTFNFYSSPQALSVGDETTPADLVGALRRTGYHEAAASEPRSYVFSGSTVVVRPSNGEEVRLQFAEGQISKIRNTSGHEFNEYALDPQLITNISDSGREKRTMVRFQDIPRVLVNAVISAEDKRFFQHVGFDPLRIGKALYVDVKDKRKEQGASTLTMQLARNLWLDRDKNWKRKAAELLITLHLEQKLSKQQIFEFYCNQVYLGGRGTFHINGFGEASRAFFNKDIRKLALPEAALLAGLIQRPSYFNPFRYPDRARDRRNIILLLMHQNGYVSDADYADATGAPLGLNPGQSELSESQYFLDLAGDEVQKRLEEHENLAANVYTTLDLRLQQSAEAAVKSGLEEVDKQIRARGHHKKGEAMVLPQVALIAMDPHTGEIKALVGGRDYSTSQLNRVLAKRPAGSSFKPFVYAAAMNSAVNGGEKIYTPGSTVVDEPTTFHFDNQTYSPSNFKHEFHGTVTFRKALAKSMNVAAVKVAQMVGYQQVVNLARQAGMNEEIKATPALALGAYEVQPLEIASAYTIFANAGVLEKPEFLSSVLRPNGAVLYQEERRGKRVLDPRVAYLMVSMLEEVMRSGTAAGVRGRGFTLPAAGKTGTSHDGWFAGFTSELLCIVWVGYDDYRELNLEGAHSALPIWTNFMKDAARFKRYRDVKPFPVPEGVVKVSICGASGKLPTSFCPYVTTDFFVDGTQPTTACTLHTDFEEFHLTDADPSAETPEKPDKPENPFKSIWKKLAH